MSERKKSKKPLPEKKPLSHGWIVMPSKTYPDRVYFYNKVTKCSTWENPCEFSRNKSSDQSSCESSSSSSCKKSKSHRTSRKSSWTSQVKRGKARTNEEIEDYDEQHDQYFANVPVSPLRFPYSNASSPPSSPDSASKDNLTDPLKFNSVLEDDKKELWLQFASSPKKPGMRKSLALSNFEEPSTSGKGSGSERGKTTPRLSLLSGESSGKESKTKKKKKKRSLSRQKKKAEDKTINTVSFKRRDKTPAQTRLLKVRQQNAEMLKKLSGGAPARREVSPKFSSDSMRSSGSSDKDEIDVHLKRIEGCEPKTDDNGATDFSEEMDWEPSNEELDVQNINEFRQKRDKANKMPTEIFFGLSSAPSLPFQSNFWLLVLDTNILVSCLSFIKEIRDINIPGLGYPVFYIPWRVLQELDHLKDSKFITNRHNAHLHWNIRRCISYLNDNFRSKHPRCIGQSYEDFAEMVDVEASAPDDEILQTCLQMKKRHPDKKVTLLTNDKNLESKAIISGLEVYSKERFQKQYLLSGFSVSSAWKGDPNTVEADATQIDNAVCAVKSILRIVIPVVVEEEMKSAFQEDWAKVAYRKPPWTLQESMECFIKHWRSVFFLVFSKETLLDVEKLYEKLFMKEIGTSEDVSEMKNTTQRLLTGIRKFLNKKKAYAELNASIPKFLALLGEISQKRPPAQMEREPSPQGHSATPQLFPAANGSLFQSEPEESLTDKDVNDTKNLFREIWESLRSYCCSVSDIINSTSANNNVSIPEIRLKLSQVLSELEELILTIGNIFEVNLKDIHEGHPLVLHLSHFLIKGNPSMAPELKMKLPKCLAAFFTDPDGRALLGGSLIDFRDFSRDLTKAREYFDENH